FFTFYFTTQATLHFYDLSLHDALPIFNLRTGMPDFVIAENRKSNGIVHFHFLVKSILNRDFVRFYYQKFDSEEKKFYEIVPYALDRKSTRLNSSHVKNSYAVFCLKKKK